MNKGQFRVPKRTQKDYSLAFKLQGLSNMVREAIKAVQSSE